jgi:CRP-like cAMP-binding protein
MHHPFSEFRTVLEEKLTGWNLPAELAAEIEEHSTPVTFEKGAIVFLRGAPAELVFWLRKGFVKLYLPHVNGKRLLVAVARPGEPVGTVANLDAGGRSHQIFEAQTLTKCSLGLLSRERMLGLLRKLDHERVIQLLGNLNAAWSVLFERHAGFIVLSFRERLEMVFKDLAARFGIEDRRGTLIILDLNQDALAEMIGSSRPMVSKLIGEMIKEGLLAHGEQRHYIIPGPAKRQSKSVQSTDVMRQARAAGDSKSLRMAVRPSISPGLNKSQIAVSATSHSSGGHNV